MDLGEVSETAHIWINGKFAGARIFAPFVFDITDEINVGINAIKVRVGNTIAVNAGQGIGKCGLMGSIVIKNENYRSNRSIDREGSILWIRNKK